MLGKLITPVTPLAQNCSLLWEKREGLGCFIDPGGDLENLIGAAQREGVTIQCILLTHGHLDHAAGAGELAKHYGVPIHGPHIGDLFLVERLPHQCAMYGFPVFEPFLPDTWLKDGDKIRIGQGPDAIELEVRHTPGHTPGHVVYYHRHSQLAFVGDVLFKNSIGRTDLPGGDKSTLVRSICQKLWPLGDDVAFVPGHGPMSTFILERHSNPHVADSVTGYRS